MRYLELRYQSCMVSIKAKGNDHESAELRLNGETSHGQQGIKGLRSIWG